MESFATKAAQVQKYSIQRIQYKIENKNKQTNIYVKCGADSFRVFRCILIAFV